MTLKVFRVAVVGRGGVRYGDSPLPVQALPREPQEAADLPGRVFPDRRGGMPRRDQFLDR